MGLNEIRFVFCAAIFLVGMNLNAQVQVKTPRAATVTKLGSSEKKHLAAGQSFELDAGEAAMFQSPDRLPVLVLAVKSAGTELSLEAPSFQDWPTEELDRRVSEIGAEIIRAQSLLTQNRAAEALSVISAIEQKYPKVFSLQFIKASANFLSGNHHQAIENLKLGLSRHPNNQEAIQMLDVLENRAPRTPARVDNE